MGTPSGMGAPARKTAAITRCSAVRKINLQATTGTGKRDGAGPETAFGNRLIFLVCRNFASMSIHRNIEIEVMSIHRNIEIEVMSIHRNIEIEMMSIHRNIEIEMMSIHRNIEIEMMSIHRNIEIEGVKWTPPGGQAL
jgi:hypothetical protein